MNTRFALMLAASLCAGTHAEAQAAHPGTAPIPMTEAAIGAWAAAIADRAAALLSSSAQWNRSDRSPCSAAVETRSLRCALQLAVDETKAPPTPAVPGRPAPLSDCVLQRAGARHEGNCGEFLEEPSVFSIERVKAVTSGVWRKDVQPIEVWSGRMTNAEGPATTGARRLIDVVAPGKYKNARLAEFNDDTTVTFADLQAFFRALHDRLVKLSAADAASLSEDVEIEIYAGGPSIIRTYAGWFPVSGFSANATTLRFHVDTAHQILTSALDRQIIQRADAILASDAVWNRADDRKCDPAATTWSIYCALERATRELTGGFHHRRPALETVRLIVEARTKDRNYSHRLMDYNNDKSTTLADVRSLFAEAAKR